MNTKILSLTSVALLSLLGACSDNEKEDLNPATTREETHESVNIATRNPLPEVDASLRIGDSVLGIINEEAPIPSQCYTKTEAVHNPCYTCHQSYPRLEANAEYRVNQRDDGANQGIYTFSKEGETNAWHNLFIDRSDWVTQISDTQILDYINQDNYTPLIKRLKERKWEGFIPDLKNYHLAAEAFDEKGFAKDDSHWVAFNYKPFPGTFWPTNGSTDDVLVRLPAAFRELNGAYNESVYLINLSIVEMTIKDIDQVDIFPVNERELNIDINRDGVMRTGTEKLSLSEYFAGDAKNIPVTRQQYPEGTEIMHSVRYVGVNDYNEVVVPPRMKELRYMLKTKVVTDTHIDNVYRRERKEKLDEQLPFYTQVGDRGFNNKFGWLVQGYIEDYDGQLRPQSTEEGMFCMGCHSAIGTTIDHTFALPRKVTGKAGWGYINLKGMKDAPNKGELEGEILRYLRVNGGGNEFRENEEMSFKWYYSDGSLREDDVRNADVYELITPTPERALKLNKAYTQIVRTQSYIHGRDASVKPAVNILKEIDESVAPLRPQNRIDGWDIRLIDWE